MIRICTTGLTVAVMALSLASHSHAVTLTNRDAIEQRLQITESDNEAESRDVVVATNETLYDLCPDGCTILMENGNQESFEGYEVIDIEDGEFVIAE